MIIDFHTHIFSPSVKTRREDYVRGDPLFAQLYTDPRAKLTSAEELIAMMDEQEIAASVVLNIGWSRPELCRESNDYIMEAVSRFPERLYGFGMVDFSSPESALNELERLFKNGIKGVGEVRFSSTQSGNTQRLQPILEYIINKGLILMVHTSEPVGHQYPGKGECTPELLYPLINGFPNLTLVCAHWGGGLPFYALMPEVKQALSHVYFDSAASPFLYSPRIYSEIAALAGDRHILFGSDFPLLTPGRLLQEIDGQNLPESTRDRLLYANAAELLGISE
jgi:uncharacterized protein